jgi:poly(U)-specific endoribonuclease
LQNQNRRQDDAPQPLFSYVDESVLSRPTFQTFVALLDNYTAQVGVTERVTQSELQENSTFLHHIMQTPCMRYLHQYLLAKGKTSNHDVEGFIRELNHFWFDMYSRKKTNDSSGFEHVFIGEVSDLIATCVNSYNENQLTLRLL